MEPTSSPDPSTPPPAPLPARTSWQALVLWLVLIALLATGAVMLYRAATMDATSPSPRPGMEFRAPAAPSVPTDTSSAAASDSTASDSTLR